MAEGAHHAKEDAHRRLIETLGVQAGDVERLTRGLDEESLARRLEEKQWSLKELVCHLWRVQQVFIGRIEAMLREDGPEIVSYEPSEDAEFEALAAQPAWVLLAEYLSDRRRLAGKLEGLSPADWHRPGRHVEFPHYDIHFSVEYMLSHEAHHLYQMLVRRSQFGPIPH